MPNSVPPNRQTPPARRTLLVVACAAAVCFAVFVCVCAWLVKSLLAPANETVVVSSSPAASAAAQAQPVTDTPAVPTVTIGGLVNDDQRHPLPNAAIHITWPQPQNPQNPAQSPRYTSRTVYSNDAGQWSFDALPKNRVDQVRITFAYSDYPAITIDTTSSPQLLTGSAVTVLRKGIDLTAQVVHADGQPIEGAQVTSRPMWSNDPDTHPNGTTDATGKVVLHGIRAGEVATLIATHLGLAPSMLQLQIPADANMVTDIRITLTPGRTVTGKVSDESGQAIAGAIVTMGVWQGLRRVNLTVNTDANGNYTFEHLPNDQFNLNATIDGYNRTALICGPNQSTMNFRISKLFRISGTVTDAVTHEPIRSFKVFFGAHGSPERPVSFLQAAARPFVDGHYLVTPTGFGGRIADWSIRISADGYVTATSPPLHDSGDQNFELVRGDDLHGQVLTPSGSPDPGTPVLMVLPGQQLFIFNGQLPYNNRGQTVADDAGKFAIPPATGQCLLVADGPNGWAISDQDALAHSTDLHEAPWGNLSVTLKIGGLPAPNQPVHLLLSSPDQNGPDKPSVFDNLTGNTDSQGAVLFTDIPPGTWIVNRVVNGKDPSGAPMTSYVPVKTLTINGGIPALLTVEQ
ncbi:MAG: carboxypeptidase-like regulatory domain-containing protein [Tepidisphaeraceae bacterium]